MRRYDSTGEMGTLSPIFDEVALFGDCFASVSTRSMVEKVKLLMLGMNNQNGGVAPPNVQSLSVRSRAFRFREKKNRPHPIMVSNSGNLSQRWMEFSEATSTGDFSVNAIVK